MTILVKCPNKNHNKTRLKNVDNLLALLLWGPLIIFQLYRGGLIEETGGFGEHPKSQVTDKLLSHNVVSSTHWMSGIRTRNVS